MKGVLVIDHATERGSALCQKIRELGWSCEHISYVTGDNIKELPGAWTRVNRDNLKAAMSERLVLFIHVNNKFCLQFCEQICGDKWVVIYSGGKIERTDIPYLTKTPALYKRHCVFEEPIGDDVKKVPWNLREFLKAAEMDRPDACLILNGFDPRLECGIKILEKFLPIDIELQLGDIAKLDSLMTEFEEGMIEMSELVQELMGIKVNWGNSRHNIETFDDSTLSREVLEGIEFLNRLLKHFDEIKKVMRSNGRGEIKKKVDSIFGFEMKAGMKTLEPETGSGFHRTYEKLRDSIFRIMEA